MATASPIVRVLMLDDDPDDYELTRDLLTEIPGAHYQLDWIDDPDTALQRIVRCEHDVYLIDYRLGKRDGLEILRDALCAGCKGPMILITGQEDRELALQALEAGADDYLVKGKFDSLSLERAIRYSLQQRRHAAELENKVAERTAELARSNDALRRSEQELRRADRRKDEFLATLAHELRNPLAPLVNALHLLRASRDATITANAREIMERQLGHLVRLVDDLLDISRITHGKIKLNRQRLNLNQILDHALETSRPLLSAANHAMEVKRSDEPVYVQGDEIRLAQIFSNILNNAGKYTDPGGHIGVSVTPNATSVTVRIKDSGVGIAPAMLPHVFELFAQIEPTLKRSQGGLGIGLSLVRRLVEMHGGSIEARSDGLGHGSEFLVTLPLDPQSQEEAPASTERSPQARHRIYRALVVDDNRDSAYTLMLLLKSAGSDAEMAHDGPRALVLAESYRPDVVLLDIGLPGLNGYEVCRTLRSQPWAKKLRLVAVSGWGNESDRAKSREAGFDAHLIKPVDHAKLLELLDSL